MPPFRIDGGLAMALARGLADGGLILAFGALLHARFVAPSTMEAETHRALRRWAGASIAFALLAAAAWLALETQSLAGGISAPALRAVLGGTRFGHLLLGRAALLAGAWLVWRLGFGVAACLLAGAALASAAGLSHAAAMGRPVWLGSLLLHLLAAGAWIGGLVPLWLVLRRESIAVAELTARRFSALGFVCVAVLLATAALQGLVLVGSWRGLFGTDYGWMALAKAAGFAAMLGLAARHRFRLMPSMRVNTAMAGTLRRSVLAELAVGAAVVLAAGLLAQMEPAIHQVPGGGAMRNMPM